MTWPYIETIFLLFIVYSFLGCVIQATYIQFCAIVFKEEPSGGNFLHLPLTPIYGFGSLIILGCINYFLPNNAHPIAVFAISFVSCSILEFATGELLKLIFKKNTWWDYSTHKFNLDGQVCLLNAALFGIAGVFVYYFVQPAIFSLGSGLSPQARELLFWLFFTLFTADFIASSIEHWKASHHPTLPSLNQSKQMIQKQYRELEIKFTELKKQYQEATNNLTALVPETSTKIKEKFFD